jgi:hypothetical protein
MGLNPRLISKGDKKDLLCPNFIRKQGKSDKNSPNSDLVRIHTNLIRFRRIRKLVLDKTRKPVIMWIVR